MGALSKAVGLATGAAAHVAAAVARILHLSAVLPAALRLKPPERDDEPVALLRDGDEYVSEVVIETSCGGGGPVERTEYVEAVKLEAVAPGRVPDARASEQQSAEDYIVATDKASGSESPVESLEPDEEVVELSDEEDVPMAISNVDKAAEAGPDASPPRGINVVAFAEERRPVGRKRGDRAPLAETAARRDLQPHTTTFEGTPYVRTTGGSMALAPEAAEAECSFVGLVRGKTDEESPLAKAAAGGGRSSDSASVETNATETTEDDRLRGLADSLAAAGNEVEADAFEELAGAGAVPTARELAVEPRPGELSLSATSSLSSISSEDDLSALRAEFGRVDFLPTITTATTNTVTL